MSRHKVVSLVALFSVVAGLATGSTAVAAVAKPAAPEVPSADLIAMPRQPAGMPEHMAIAQVSPATLDAGLPDLTGGAGPRAEGETDSGPAAGINVRTTGPGGGTQAEISMAATGGGQNIVISYNGGPSGLGFVSSQNGGRTFSANQSPPTPAGSNPCCDPSVVGDAGSNFYLIQLFRDDGANTPNAGNCTNSLHVSSNGGQTFSSIVSSPFSYAPGNDFPDQPHIGIDRNNLVGGQPQLYVTTRHFTSGVNCPQTGGGGNVQGEIVCSNDGGATWSNSLVWNPFTDTAHIGVAPDGRVYVAGMGIGTNAGTSRVLLWRSTSSGATGCPGAGNTMGFTGPTVVADNLTFGAVVDREFPQPDVIVDPANSQRVYISYSADDTQGSGDREAFLARCDFVAATGTCQAPTTINDNPVDGTDQYFPMTCVDPVSNAIYASWNDARLGTNHQIRAATVTNNGATVSASRQVSDATWPIVNFGGAPDYGDYNENNAACRANHHYAAWTSQVSPPGMTPASNDPDVFFAVVNDAPVANADGPYTTAEGSNVALSGSATDTENDTPFVFEWDFDNDSQFDDATGQTPSFTNVGQDGSFPVCLRVTDSVGDSSAPACSTVTVTNVAPSVSLGADDPRDEGATLTLSGAITDPGWLEDLSGTVNWGDGSPTEALSGTLENDRPNATLSYSATHIYGDNALYPVQVCGFDDDTSTCNSISVQIDNVAPTVTRDPAQDMEIDEGDVLSVLFDFTDPGWLDTYTSSVSWGYVGFPSETGTLAVDPDNPPNPDTGTLTASRQYGDNGTFTVTGTVTDDDAGTDSDSFDVTVNNLDPTATIDTTGATDINGNPTFIAHAGETVPFSANSTDAGSDDLFLSWDWDDGPPAPDVSTAYLLNDPFFDLLPSPEVAPRNVDDSKSHAFGDACLYDVVFSAGDDDSGSAADNVAVIIQGNGTRRKSEGYWKSQYSETGVRDFTTAELECYLEIAGYISNVFNEVVDVSTFPRASTTLSPQNVPSKQLERALLAALLNFANGSIEYDQVLGGVAFGDAITNAEAVRLDPTSTDAELRQQARILERFNRQ